VIELGIFAVLVEKRHRGTGVSVTQLAEYTGAEPDLIGMVSACFWWREPANSGSSPFDACHDIARVMYLDLGGLCCQ
jgi:hypothetical protein